MPLHLLKNVQSPDSRFRGNDVAATTSEYVKFIVALPTQTNTIAPGEVNAS